MNRYQILIEYEGTLYNGWQIQKKGKSIQENIEIILSNLLKEKIKIYGSGRTDSGVHAKEQSAKIGEVIDEQMTIACGENSINIIEIQKEGKNPQFIKEFLLGNKVRKGTIIKSE